MGEYFEADRSIFYGTDGDTCRCLETVANAYIGRNPERPFLFSAFPDNGIPQLGDARYDINIGSLLPDTSKGSYACAYGMIWNESSGSAETAINCYGPVKIYVNGVFIFKSGVFEEVNIKKRRLITIPLQKGWNGIFIVMKKVGSGFGCIFGPDRSVFSFDVFSPFSERKGMSGWIYSVAMESDVFKDGAIPAITSSEDESGVRWYPVRERGKDDRNSCQIVFGETEDKYIYGWTSIYGENVAGNCVLTGQYFSDINVWINGSKVFSGKSAGQLSVSASIKYGHNDIIIESKTQNGKWGFFAESPSHTFKMPCRVEGADNQWLYIGTFDSPVYPDRDIRSLYGDFGNVYWRVEKPLSYVRPYCINRLFGRWNYPLGVTLFGLLRAGEMLGRRDIQKYVRSHISECVKMYGYSLWDAKKHGFPAINTKLVELKLLDDCGSMGAAMLEALAGSDNDGYKTVTEVIADYIMNRQQRRSDGVFFRKCEGIFMENTLWADDLYMSIPFLIRCSGLTGDQSYIDEACRQLLLFKKYLYMTNVRLMSHIYDFKYGMPTQIPWGRGNGWTLFALSELLEALSREHPLYAEVVEMLRSLCEGVLAVQGADGRWHQVLTDPDSYAETSCTAMFIYAFARSVRLGLLDNATQYIKAINRAWKSITENTVDREGNIYGVCVGSRYSFDEDYYKYELPPHKNDTHGIGIVLLAGVEVSKLEEYLCSV